MTDRARPSRPGTILGVLALANIVGYAARNALYNVYPDLRDRFDLHDAKLGLLTTAFIVPHAIATLPLGWAGDRYDRRRVIAVGLAIAGLASAAGALANDTVTFAVSRAVVGFGTAAIVPVANSILGQIYDGPHKASRMAIFNLGLLVGALVGVGAGLAVGFPLVVVVVAVPSVLLAVVLIALPMPAPHVAPRGRSESAPQGGGLVGSDRGPAPMPLGRYVAQLGRLFVVDGRALLRIRTLRWLIVSTTAMAFAGGGYAAWLIDFLERDKHMARGEATSLLAITGIGALSGILTGARLADRLRRRYAAGRLWTITIGMVCALPCAVACLALPPGPLLYIAGITTMFFISWYHAPMAVTVDDLAPRSRAVAAQSLVIFTMHLLGTATSSYLIGVVSDHSSLYTAMWVPTGALVIAAVAMLAATPSFARDHAAARAGEVAPASL